MKVLITGANGFIGKHLNLRLQENGGIEVLTFNRGDSFESLTQLVTKADTIVHLAGEMRPKNSEDLIAVNVDLTRRICEILRTLCNDKFLILASSVQAEQDSLYGVSKLQAEKEVTDLSVEVGTSIAIYRLPHVFGKWCKPNYNSVIATFCHNISRGLPIRIDDPSALITPVFIDDVIDEFFFSIKNRTNGVRIGRVEPEYSISVGELANILYDFSSPVKSFIDHTASGLIRALYSTYISYVPVEKFTYELPIDEDSTGCFVEILRSKHSGQVSFFTLRPGVTRDNHYHHTKTEKFLVVSGRARLRFRHLVTLERFEITVAGEKPMVVQSIPGWVHDITNTGENDAVVLIWANELFDRDRPDTFLCKV